MADPITLSLVAAGIGTAFSVIGAVRQGQAESNAANYNAQVAERNAVISRDQAQADAALFARDSRKRLGAIRAAVGASGVAVEGSPLDVLEESAANAELDRQTILYKGELKALGFEDTAKLDRSQARIAKEESFFRAGTALLTGGADIFGKLPGKAVTT